MKKLVIIADAWGTAEGGINAFNMDFTMALGRLLKPREIKVICVVTEPLTIPADLLESNVELVVIVPLQREGRLNVYFADEINDVLKKRNIIDDKDDIWWIGHDFRTGHIALRLKLKFGKGKSVLIHHMRYKYYKAYAGENAERAQYMAKQQEELFKVADYAFGVGPLLHKSLIEIKSIYGASFQVGQIIPGLADIKPVLPHDNPYPQFSAITYGRLDIENDRLKQVKLGLNAFAVAVDTVNSDPYAYTHNTLRNAIAPALYAIGINLDEVSKQNLIDEVNSKAGRAINFIPLPYTTNREELFDQLRTCSAAMMLSWHDGYGLVGWEAISAGVPLIISSRSGLYQLIEEQCDAEGLALVQTIDVNGKLGGYESENYTTTDLNNVSKAIIAIASDVSKAKQRAQRLKEMLQRSTNGKPGATWAAAARSFAEELGIIERKLNKSEDSLAYNETRLYASDEVKTSLLSQNKLNFFAIDDSIRLMKLSLKGTTEDDSERLRIDYDISKWLEINTKSVKPTNSELHDSITEFESSVKSYLIKSEHFKENGDEENGWKIGLQIARPYVEGIDSIHNVITILPLNYLAIDLFNRQLIRNRVPMLNGGKNDNPELVKIYEDCIESLLRSRNIYKFMFPSQLFIELAIVTSDNKVILVKKNANPGAGVVAEIKRAWTCGPEIGLTFKYLDENNSIVLHKAIAFGIKNEFGIENNEIEHWQINGLCLQHVHLNTALYGYCRVSLQGKEVAERVRTRHNIQFYLEADNSMRYPEVIDLSDIPALLEQESRSDGLFWHPTAKIRLHSLINLG